MRLQLLAELRNADQVWIVKADVYKYPAVQYQHSSTVMCPKQKVVCCPLHEVHPLPRRAPHEHVL